jgi:hypothetical protein
MFFQRSDRSEEGAARSPLSADMEALARRFPATARRDVRRLLRTSPRFCDLGIVFPGALLAIALRQTPLALRLEAQDLVVGGAPLKVVAQTLALPLWMRRLPPEAYHQGLPPMPQSDAFARRIANRLPERRREAALWLASVSFAARAAHEDFAVWLAEQEMFAEAGVPEQLFGLLAAYAWFSRAHASRAGRLILVPWRAEMGFDTALCSAKSWLNRMRLVMQLKPGAIVDTWVSPGSAGGYTFNALTSAGDLLAEAHAMHNCADQYADRLARDKCRLFAIRRNGQSVATLEVGPHQREVGVLAITQLKGRHNMPAPLEVWQAAHIWFGSQKGLRRTPALIPQERPLDAGEWAALMEPYRDAKGGAPWLLPKLGASGLAELDGNLAELARRAGVTSWLFT